jgi:uncharacterized repeat protein (TIGR04076 family)
MKKTIIEDYEFTVHVLSVGPDNNPEHCRMGFEAGDTFTCKYDCPYGFCPKTMFKLHTLCEAMRAGGDLRNLGGDDPMGIKFTCADGPVMFYLKAKKLDNIR